MKINYKLKELYDMLRKAIISLLTGVCGIAWVIMLLVINLAIRGYKKAISGIRTYPCVAVGLTFFVMLVVVMATHMNMKVKLTTTEWQRDSLEQKLDSAKVGKTLTYFKYKNY